MGFYAFVIFCRFDDYTGEKTGYKAELQYFFYVKTPPE
jgi:hypothetical protein